MSGSSPNNQPSLVVRVAFNVILVLIIALFAGPFIWMLLSSFDTGRFTGIPSFDEVGLTNYRELFEEQGIGRALLNSFLIAVPSALLATAVASLAGYGLSRLRWKRKMLGMYSLLLLQSMPVAVTMVAIYNLASRLDLIDSRFALIIIHTCIVLPLLIWLMVGYYDGLPRFLDEAAALDGRSRFELWWEILLPLTKPGIAVAFGLAFAAAWSEVLLVIVLITRIDLATLPFHFFYAADGSNAAQQVAALGVLYIVPVALVFLLLKRYLAQGMITSTRGL